MADKKYKDGFVTNESFAEAGGLERYVGWQARGVVVDEVSSFSYQYAFDKAQKSLLVEATIKYVSEDSGFGIFNLRHNTRFTGKDYVCKIEGTVYTPE